MSRYIILTLLFFIFPFTSANNGDPLKETLSKAEELIELKEYEAAEILLKRAKLRTSDFYLEWLYAKVLGEQGKVKEMDETFRKTIQLHDSKQNEGTNLDYVFLNYSEYLIKNKCYQDALHKLDLIIYSKPKMSTLEYLYPLYFECCYEQKTEKIDIDNYRVLEAIERTLIARNKNILNKKSPNKDKEWSSLSSIKLGFEAQKDIQPMKTVSTRILADLPKKNLVNLTFDFSTDTFCSDDFSNVTIWRWYAANKFRFWKPDLDILVGGGWVDRTRQKGSYMLALDVVKRFKSLVSFNAGFKRQLYMGTLASAYKELVMQNNVYFNVEHKFRDAYTIAVQSQQSTFEDDNKVISVGGWGLVKIPTFSWMSFHVGYGFSYSHADEMRYTADVPYNDLMTAYEVGEQVNGVYDQYFTPNRQKIHLGIGSLGFKLGERLNLNATLKYAIDATCEAPLLYLYQNDEGYPYTLTFYYKAKYTPYDATVTLDYKITDTWKLNMFYQQNETFYYKENRGGISTTINF